MWKSFHNIKWYIQNYRKKFSQFWLYVLKAGDAKGSGKKRILRKISATKTRRYKKKEYQGWEVQSSTFWVEKANTAHIKWILYWSWLGSRFTQLVRIVELVVWLFSAPLHQVFGKLKVSWSHTRWRSTVLLSSASSNFW